MGKSVSVIYAVTDWAEDGDAHPHITTLAAMINEAKLQGQLLSFSLFMIPPRILFAAAGVLFGRTGCSLDADPYASPNSKYSLYRRNGL